MRKKYETDLTDEQWAEIEPLFIGMRKRKWEKRELVNAVLYLVKTGCQWRNLPHDFPPVFTVHSFYRRARLSGLWDRILQHLVKITREKAGRNAEPSYAIIDSQSVKTTSHNEKRGYDGGKNERKKTSYSSRYNGQFIICENLLFVKVHSATIHDTKSGIFPALFAYLIYKTIKGYSADGGYRRTFEEQVKNLLNVIVDISIKIKSEGFHVIPKRWIVERTFAWLNWSRRLCKDFEITTDSEETIVKIYHIHTLLKRL